MALIQKCLQILFKSVRNVSQYKNFFVMQKESISEQIEQGESGVPCPRQDQAGKVGSWTFHENLLYIIFLDLNKLVMVSKKKRRNTRIFDLMSEYVMSRNPLQCRSHHQKLIEKFGEIKTIINNFKKMVGKDYYREKYLLCKTSREERINIGKQMPIIPKVQVALSEDSPTILEEKMLPICPIETAPCPFVPFSSYYFDNPFFSFPFMGNFLSLPSLF